MIPFLAKFFIDAPALFCTPCDPMSPGEKSRSIIYKMCKNQELRVDDAFLLEIVSSFLYGIFVTL